MNYKLPKYSKIKRLALLLLFNLFILLAAFAYKLAAEYGILSAAKCLFSSVMVFPCPGCGGTRALIALLSFDILRSALLYPPLIITALIILYLDIRIAVRIILGGEHIGDILRLPIILAIPISIILFFIVRTVMFFLGFDLLSFASSL